MTAEHEQTDDDHEATDAPDGGEQEQQLYRTTGNTMSRRDFLQVSAAAAGAAATGGATTQHPALDPVGEAQALGNIVPTKCQIRAMYNKVEAYVQDIAGALSRDPDNRPSPEEVQEAVADQAHINAYGVIRSQRDAAEVFHRSNENVATGPEGGGLSAILWSEIRKSVYNTLVNGGTVTEAITAARDAARKYISDRIQIWIEEWNRFCREIEYERYVLHRKALKDDNFNEGSFYTGLDGYQNALYSNFFAGSTDGYSNGSIPDYQDMRTQYEMTLPDGRAKTAEVAFISIDEYHTYSENYAHRLYWPGATTEDLPSKESTNWPQQFVDGYYAPIEVAGNDPTSRDNGGYRVTDSSGQSPHAASPYGDGADVLMYDVAAWEKLITAALDYHQSVQSQIGDYVQGIYDAYNAGEIDASDILSGIDMVRGMGDSGLDRATAELINTGYAVDSDDISSRATVSGGGLGEQKTGLLLMQFNMDILRSWEYSVTDRSYDSENDETTLSVNIADPSIETNDTSDSQDGAELAWTVTVAPDGSNPSTAQIAQSDLNDQQTATVTVGGDRTGDVAVEVVRDFSAMNMVTRVDAGQTIEPADYQSAVLLEPTESTVKRHYLEGTFSVESVDIDGADRNYLEFSQYAYRDGVPDRSYERMQEQAEVREEIHVTLDNSTGGGGGINIGGGGGALQWALGGLGVMTVLGIIAQALDDNDPPRRGRR